MPECAGGVILVHLPRLRRQLPPHVEPCALSLLHLQLLLLSLLAQLRLCSGAAAARSRAAGELVATRCATQGPHAVPGSISRGLCPLLCCRQPRRAPSHLAGPPTPALRRGRRFPPLQRSAAHSLWPGADWDTISGAGQALLQQLRGLPAPENWANSSEYDACRVRSLAALLRACIKGLLVTRGLLQAPGAGCGTCCNILMQAARRCPHCPALEEIQQAYNSPNLYFDSAITLSSLQMGACTSGVLPGGLCCFPASLDPSQLAMQLNPASILAPFSTGLRLDSRCRARCDEGRSP